MKLLLDDDLQRRQMLFDDFPDAVKLKVEIPMRGDVSKAVDATPPNLRVTILDGLGWRARRFGQRFKSPQDRIPEIDVIEECFAPLRRARLN
jgi:hypothetical protein